MLLNVINKIHVCTRVLSVDIIVEDIPTRTIIISRKSHHLQGLRRYQHLSHVAIPRGDLNKKNYTITTNKHTFELLKIRPLILKHS